MSGKKTRSVGQILKKPCVRTGGHIFSPIIVKLRMFLLMKSRTSVKMIHVRSKTRSIGQILEKRCVRCRGHIFSVVIIKQCQNVGLDEILDDFKNGSCWVKN